MPTYVYLSKERGELVDGVIEPPPESDRSDPMYGQRVMTLRGECGPNDDPASYKRLMTERGYRVELTAVNLGKSVNLTLLEGG